MLTFTFDTFMKDCFGEYKKPTIQEFRDNSRLIYNAGEVSLRDFAMKLNDDDYRKNNFDYWSDILYTAYIINFETMMNCLLYTSPSPRDP